MERFYEQKVFTDFHVDVKVNGAHLIYTGAGEGDAVRGIVNVGVKTENRIPDGFRTGVLSFTLITGQADISQKGKVTNPFQMSLGAYKARRTLDLANLGRLTADYVVSSPEGNRRKATFQIVGDVDLPTLVSIEPTIEKWRSQSDRTYRGNFQMTWKTADGRRVTGVTETLYEFPRPIPNPQLLARSIDFELKAAEQRMFQSEIIRLYRDEPTDSLAERELATATR